MSTPPPIETNSYDAILWELAAVAATICYGFGGVLSLVMSWTANHSVVMAIAHAFCSWGYVLWSAIG